ncbi:hypothetical protein CEXT_95821 [Caerostris extrusa]|uniref:Uncharacterized protein n=1 Tax=Caerostris extrusa TaxID=172846 RepID=A0AAV4RAC2_CAEEX|nr:hypothetical protein CEXT_95821 [Caerostris extrusa]
MPLKEKLYLPKLITILQPYPLTTTWRITSHHSHRTLTKPLFHTVPKRAEKKPQKEVTRERIRKRKRKKKIIGKKRRKGSYGEREKKFSSKTDRWETGNECFWVKVNFTAILETGNVRIREKGWCIRSNK